MTSTATFTLSGRYYSGPRATSTTEQGRGHVKAVTRRVARKRFEAGRRAYERQNVTDAYLDREGPEGVSLAALLAGFAGR